MKERMPLTPTDAATLAISRPDIAMGVPVVVAAGIVVRTASNFENDVNVSIEQKWSEVRDRVEAQRLIRSQGLH